MNFPKFTYHPNPILTGAIVKSENICTVCKQTRGYIYSKSHLICPWCIADGNANKALNVEFTPLRIFEQAHECSRQVNHSIAEEIAFRTPAFDCLQDHHWITHCNDGCAFLGAHSGKEVLQQHPELIQQIKEDYVDEECYTVEDYLEELGSAVDEEIYVFQCLHCGHKECYIHAD